jgi:hypothetical protein
MEGKCHTEHVLTDLEGSLAPAPFVVNGRYDGANSN